MPTKGLISGFAFRVERRKHPGGVRAEVVRAGVLAHAGTALQRRRAETAGGILPSRHDSLRSARLTGLDSANSSLTTFLAREMRIEGDPTTCERTLDRPKPYRRRR
jgi:hypothetical protein